MIRRRNHIALDAGMTANPEQMWQRFAGVHGLDVNDAGRPFFVDGVMAGRTPADDAGEVAVLRAEVERLRTANHEFIATPIADMREQRDEARAEADRLRAEVERLTKQRGGLYDDVANTRIVNDRLRATLGAVAEKSEALLDFLVGNGILDDGHFNPPTERELAFHMGGLSDALIAADPVSLAGKCGTPGCDGDARYAAPGRGHIETCKWPTDPVSLAGVPACDVCGVGQPVTLRSFGNGIWFCFDHWPEHGGHIRAVTS